MENIIYYTFKLSLAPGIPLSRGIFGIRPARKLQETPRGWAISGLATPGVCFSGIPICFFIVPPTSHPFLRLAWFYIKIWALFCSIWAINCSFVPCSPTLHFFGVLCFISCGNRWVLWKTSFSTPSSWARPQGSPFPGLFLAFAHPRNCRERPGGG